MRMVWAACGIGGRTVAILLTPKTQGRSHIAELK
jgi:hypothetical protein